MASYYCGWGTGEECSIYNQWKFSELGILFLSRIFCNVVYRLVKHQPRVAITLTVITHTWAMG